jgi:hypothetical protein
MGKPKGKGKKIPNNSDKILLIVENSEKVFFQQYFNHFIENMYDVNVVVKSSGSGNKCEITNFNKMQKKIENFLQKDNYKAVFLMIDLDSKCFESERNHNCLVELKNEYLPKYSIEKSLKERFYLFVVCNEIESWFLTIDEKKKHTNSPHENHKKEMMKLFKVHSEPQIVQRMVQELEEGKVALDFSKNNSLQHFIKKLQEFKIKNGK